MTQPIECLFCNEREAGNNTFLEDELFRARWDQIPLSPGHAEVVPKRHVQFFAELTDEERARLLSFANEVLQIISKISELPDVYERLLTNANDLTRPALEDALQKSRGLLSPPDGMNHGLNDGPSAGQTIPHFHYHLIPRWKGDMPNPRGGIRRMFENDTYSNTENK